MSWEMFRERLRDLLGGRDKIEADEVRALTQQFHVTLRASIARVEEQVVGDKPPKALERIREIVGPRDKELSWKDAYDIEQQLAHLYDPPTLEVELERRLLEADASLHPTVAQWYRKRTEAAYELEGRRALLSRLVNDLQWRHTRNEVSRRYTKEITGRTELVFVVAFAAFLILLFLRLAELASPQGLGLHTWGLVPFVALAGAFGASFSMMTSLRSRLAESSFDDLKLNRSYLMIAARVLVGIGSGFILFFFVKSGLLGGEAFPKLGSQVGEDAVKSLSAPDFAKLFIWCFVSGFSEKLVPNLLATTEGKQGGVPSAPETPTTPPTRANSGEAQRNEVRK